VQEYNADNKKSLVTEYEGNAVVEFSYIEGENYFSYDKYDYERGNYDPNTCSYSETRSEVNEKELRRPSTNAEKMFMYTSDYIDVTDYSNNIRLNGSVIVVTQTSGGSYSDSTIYEVTLAADKRYKSVKRTYISWNSGSGCGSSSNRVRKVSVGERSFSYSANPSMPSGFSASQFTDKTGDYISAKVVWGEGKGESTFWEEKCDYSGCTTSLYGESIARYAPDVTGKVIDKFTANGTEYCASSSNCSTYNYSIPVTEGMTITAVWRAGTSSMAAVQAQPSSQRSAAQRRHSRLGAE
jgi:hypothetical protein